MRELRRIALISAAASILAATPSSADKPAMPMMPPPAVAVEKVPLIKETPVGDYVGLVTAIEAVDIKARVSGFITSVHFTEGAIVKEGDLLFEIEDEIYNANVARAEAAIEQAQAELSFSESQLQRNKRLSEKDAVSLSTLEDSERLLRFNKAKLDLIKAELAIARREQSYTRILSPITGRIGRNNMTRGNYVDMSSPALAKVVMTDPVRIRFSLSERTFQELAEVYTARTDNIDVRIFMANGEEYPHKGNIEFIDNIIDSSTGTISVWMRIANPDGALIPGGYVHAVLSQQIDKALPGARLSSILADKNGSFVYVLGEGNMARRQDITLGNIVGNFYTVISGLNEGDLIITEGVHKVIPGLPVNPVAPQQPAAAAPNEPEKQEQPAVKK